MEDASFEKYFGGYEVFHYIPHTTGNPKLSNAFLNITPEKIEYVHKLFECESGVIDNVDGHFFLNLQNKEQKNAPYYMILKCINNRDVDYIGGSCMGIGENQNNHPIASKLCLRRRNDISDFTIEKFKSYCQFTELTEARQNEEFYANIIDNYLVNKCGDKAILF